MNIIQTDIPDVLIIEPKLHKDARGFFYESFNKKELAEKTGIATEFVQDNHSHSTKNVLRGLHYQIQHAQGKLVRAIEGEVFDVAVDIRKDSPTFGKWVGVHLSQKNKLMLWIPPGFAHGFVTLSKTSEVLYKTTEYWHPEYEKCLLWNDPALGIDWPISSAPRVGANDIAGQLLRDAEVYR